MKDAAQNTNTEIRMRKLGPGMALAFTPEEVREIKESKGKRLGSLDIELTTFCNLKCIYCYCSAGPVKPVNELTTAEIKGIIDDGAKLEIKVLNLTGGEPLLHPGFFEIVEYARFKKIPSLINFTDGMLVDKKAAKRMYDLGLSMCVKLDSIVPAIEDELVQQKGALKKIMQGIKNLLAVGYGKPEMPMSINCVINRLNYKDVPNVFRWARERGITPFVARMHPHGRARENPDLILGVNEIKEIFYELSRIDRGYGFYWEPNTPWVENKACRRHYLGNFINHVGDVMPCSEAPPEFKLGNIRKQKLSEILASGNVLLYRDIETNLKGACSPENCKYSREKICYGCRVLAYDASGVDKTTKKWHGKTRKEAFFEGDPCCWQNPDAIV
ncbi:MAG: radical SAM protein [Candidatus Omnitrophica bacterium]|nr:radical SAM protein [Candidatus Omnitrophota bacterium]